MLLPFDTIARSRDFDERAGAMQLRPWQWEFLHGADGRMRLGDLASRCGIDFDTARISCTRPRRSGSSMS